jgi:hypothetical protein
MSQISAKRWDVQRLLQQYERRAVNRQPGFRSGDTYRRTCFSQDFSCLVTSPVDLCAVWLCYFGGLNLNLTSIQFVIFFWNLNMWPFIFLLSKNVHADETVVLSYNVDHSLALIEAPIWSESEWYIFPSTFASHISTELEKNTSSFIHARSTRTKPTSWGSILTRGER